MDDGRGEMPAAFFIEAGGAVVADRAGQPRSRHAMGGKAPFGIRNQRYTEWADEDAMAVSDLAPPPEAADTSEENEEE